MYYNVVYVTECDELSESVLTSHEVFLGGSCNPTTWRRDTVIPLLTSLNISYYNPVSLTYLLSSHVFAVSTLADRSLSKSSAETLKA